jgi:hypothetical protein
MSPVFVVVEQIQRHQPFQMPLIQDDHGVQQVAPATSNPALRNPVSFIKTSYIRNINDLCDQLDWRCRIRFLP